MKVLIFLLAIFSTFPLSTLVGIEQKRKIGGLRILKRRIKEQTSNDYSTTCNTASIFSIFCTIEPSCGADGEYFQCLPNNMPSRIINCPESRPYCVGNSGMAYCSDTPDDDCNSEEYECIGPGTYPEIENCQAYYECKLNTDDEMIPQRVTCPQGQSYNPAISGCKKGPCVRPRCPRNKRTFWKFLNYRGYDRNRMGLLCSNGSPIMMHSCPKNMQINRKTIDDAECILICNVNKKRAPNLLDDTKYWECNKRKAVSKSCDPGQVFDSNQLICVQSTTSSVIEEFETTEGTEVTGYSSTSESLEITDDYETTEGVVVTSDSSASEGSEVTDDYGTTEEFEVTSNSSTSEALEETDDYGTTEEFVATGYSSTSEALEETGGHSTTKESVATGYSTISKSFVVTDDYGTTKEFVATGYSSTSKSFVVTDDYNTTELPKTTESIKTESVSVIKSEYKTSNLPESSTLIFTTSNMIQTSTSKLLNSTLITTTSPKPYSASSSLITLDSTTSDPITTSNSKSSSTILATTTLETTASTTNNSTDEYYEYEYIDLEEYEYL